ncbi:T-cell surface glycoprotein CD3 epsilon chain [Sinocyclocheilus rhinocerous]|uniref:T-cell surface glycoprotein CD3 epsilon chain n=1 Tax=Sinocyclocheilus rhinocerous TaxID=307959 RepID=UPI0007BA4F9D|nr:PREDICTED: T-cell surface glycoprotein CD3 epsilon chain [Sinocyclocheilus rhinocerous]
MLLLSVMFVLLAAAVMNPAQGQAIREIKEDRVILDCEGGEDGQVKWWKDNNEDKTQKNSTFEAKAEQGTVGGFFTCEYSKINTDTGTNEVIKHKFYLKIKVCENCYELSGLAAWGIMLGDVLITGGLMLIIYICAARKSNGTQKKASNPRPINPPRPPNPDYAALDPKMRSSNALYAGLNK